MVHLGIRLLKVLVEPKSVRRPTRVALSRVQGSAGSLQSLRGTPRRGNSGLHAKLEVFPMYPH